MATIIGSSAGNDARASAAIIVVNQQMRRLGRFTKCGIRESLLFFKVANVVRNAMRLMFGLAG